LLFGLVLHELALVLFLFFCPRPLYEYGHVHEGVEIWVDLRGKQGPQFQSHPILQGKPNASHVCARINLHTHDRQNECNTIAVIKCMRVKPIQYSLLHSER
jgi:hypothetical protein